MIGKLMVAIAYLWMLFMCAFILVLISSLGGVENSEIRNAVVMLWKSQSLLLASVSVLALVVVYCNSTEGRD